MKLIRLYILFITQLMHIVHSICFFFIFADILQCKIIRVNLILRKMCYFITETQNGA